MLISKEGNILSLRQSARCREKIICKDGQQIERFFFFASRIVEGTDEPQVGQRVSFQMDPSKSVAFGKLPKAVNIVVHDIITANEILCQKENNVSSESR